MNWITENATWVAAGLFIFFGLFVAGFFIRNKSAKSDTDDPVEKRTQASDLGIKRSKNL